MKTIINYFKNLWHNLKGDAANEVENDTVKQDSEKTIDNFITKDMDFDEKEILNMRKRHWESAMSNRKGGYVTRETLVYLTEKIVENVWFIARDFYMKRFQIETKPKERKEYILSAAIWCKNLQINNSDDFEFSLIRPNNILNGIVFSGHRHNNCIAMICVVTGKRMAEIGEYEQGFLTSKNRFVKRERALEIALDSYQYTMKDMKKTQLFSEDLY